MRTELFEIQLQDDEDIKEVQLLRTGKFERFGSTLEITPDILREMKRNFNKDVIGNKVAIDFSHNSFDKAAGWIEKIVLKENDTQLWVLVDWTENGRAQILAREFIYLSAAFEREFRDNETGKTFGFVLVGGGLTNRPFVKSMAEVFDDLDVSPEKRDDINRILDGNDEPEQKDKVMNFNELKEQVRAMTFSEAEAKEIAELAGVQLTKEKPAPKEKETKKKEAKSGEVELSEDQKRIKELEGENAKLEKERKFDVLLSEGNAVEAQREAFMSNDIAEFAKLKKNINLDAKGSGTGGKEKGADKDEAPKTREEAEDKVDELAEALREKDDTITLSQSYATVLSENPELNDLYEGQEAA